MNRSFPGKMVDKDWREDIPGREKSRAKACKCMTKEWAETPWGFPRYVGTSQARTL